MRVEVSPGEALDKLSILDIKLARIRDDEKRAAVQRELNVLSDARIVANGIPLLYTLLVQTNERIWDLTDTVKSLQETDPTYASVARTIFDENQMRFRIKSMINAATTSSLKEQKGYAESVITLIPTTPKQTLSALWSLALSYDTVYLSEDVHLLPPAIRPPLVRIGTMGSSILDTDVQIDRIERCLPKPINYAAGGKLGDFVHQLSVVYERYLQTGRRGCLYVGERNVGGDPFSRGLDATIRDVSPYLLTLPYIQSIETYTGQPIDINLSQWRYIPNLCSKSWQQIYGETYGVQWGARAWFPQSRSPNPSDIVLVNTSPTRWTDEVKWSVLLAKYPGTPMFLQTSLSDYQHFCERTGLRLPIVDGSSFSNIVSAVQSCRIFIGTLSMPLAVADALKKDRVAVTQRGGPDEGIAARTDPRYVNRT